MEGGFFKTVHTFEVDVTLLDVAAIHRDGSCSPIVFLHGFGSTKEDYADIVRYPAFNDRPFLVYDAPGCGETVCADNSKISIPFLVDTALAMLDRIRIKKFHLVGHSMGGLGVKQIHLNQPPKLSSVWGPALNRPRRPPQVQV